MAIMYLLNWLCIYPGGEIGHNDIFTFKLNLTLNVKVNHPPKTTGILAITAFSQKSIKSGDFICF